MEEPFFRERAGEDGKDDEVKSRVFFFFFFLPTYVSPL